MRTLKTVGKLGIVAASLFFAACSSDGGGSGVGGGSGTFIKGKVNGTAFQSLVIQGQSLASAIKTGTGDGTLIMIQGSGDMQGSKTMVMNLMGITTTGTYEIGPESDGSVLAYVESGNNTSYDTSNCEQAIGTLKVTALTDTKIEGTFNFVGKVDEDCSQTKTVTNGSFRGVFMN